jgi:hypothetical protein
MTVAAITGTGYLGPPLSAGVCAAFPNRSLGSPLSDRLGKAAKRKGSSPTCGQRL